MIQGVIFDMDGLMFDSEAVMLRGWMQAGKNVGYEMREEWIRGIMGMGEREIKERFRSLLGEDFPYDEVWEQKNRYLLDEVEAHGVPIKKGLIELLQYLKENGIKAAVATSTARERAERMLQLANVMPYFDAFVYGDMIYNGKPEPDIYLKAAELLGLAPKYCMGVEDSRNGIFSIHSAGMKGVLVPDLIPVDEEMRSRAYRCVEDLSQVIDIIREENAQTGEA